MTRTPCGCSTVRDIDCTCGPDPTAGTGDYDPRSYDAAMAHRARVETGEQTRWSVASTGEDITDRVAPPTAGTVLGEADVLAAPCWACNAAPGQPCKTDGPFPFMEEVLPHVMRKHLAALLSSAWEAGRTEGEHAGRLAERRDARELLRAEHERRDQLIDSAREVALAKGAAAERERRGIIDGECKMVHGVSVCLTHDTIATCARGAS